MPVTLVTLVGLAAAPRVEAERPPNVIVVLADDLGYGDLGCYGHKSFKTPRLDRMAAEGVRFTDYYVPTPYCAPSRAALLTGRYPFRNGMVHNPAPDQGVDVGLADDEVTLAEALKGRGYATMCIGKWHLGHKPPFYPTRHGFDAYYGILYSNDMRPVDLMEDERVVEHPAVQATLTRRYTERALAFIEANRDRPFFLYLPHAMPHKPLAASETFYKTTPTLYGDVMAELDWSVGQVLDKLTELGLDDKTLVVFTSDNGPWFGGSTGGLRGMKGRAWEGGVRVPMIARWPGRIPAGRVCREVAGVIDIFPTVTRLAGVDDDANDRVIDGRDIGPLLSEQVEAFDEPRPLFFMHGPKLVAVRSGRMKLHVEPPGGEHAVPPPKDGRPWVDPRGPDGVTILAPYEQAQPDEHPGVVGGDAPRPMMLFDLEADPAEQHDIAAHHPDAVRRLREQFDHMNAQVVPIPPPKSGPLQAPGPRPH